jgi:hypothetical protein
MGTGDSFPVVKQMGREVDHSPPFSVEVENVWSCISAPQYDLVKLKRQVYVYLYITSQIDIRGSTVLCHRNDEMFSDALLQISNRDERTS